jgi:hypothetical protein
LDLDFNLRVYFLLLVLENINILLLWLDYNLGKFINYANYYFCNDNDYLKNGKYNVLLRSLLLLFLLLSFNNNCDYYPRDFLFSNDDNDVLLQLRFNISTDFILLNRYN